jgi:hypothetical protein
MSILLSRTRCRYNISVFLFRIGFILPVIVNSITILVCFIILIATDIAQDKCRSILAISFLISITISSLLLISSIFMRIRCNAFSLQRYVNIHYIVIAISEIVFFLSLFFLSLYYTILLLCRF